ncbi:MAG: outer membrane lipoprotein carrier protein LolA [Armatimonadota bacterium]
MGRPLRLGPRATIAAFAVAVLALMTMPVCWAITGQEILGKSAALYQGVRDYTCRVTVQTDFPKVRMPTRTFTVYFKKPDKVRVESGGQLVMVPRDILLFGNFERHLKDEAKIVLAGTNTRAGRKLYFLKVLPRERGAPDRVLLWIWGDTWTIKRSEIWRRDAKILTADWEHKACGRYLMPLRVVCKVTGGRMAEKGSGTIKVDFAGWKVNSGLADSLFAQESKK